MAIYTISNKSAYTALSGLTHRPLNRRTKCVDLHEFAPDLV